MKTNVRVQFFVSFSVMFFDASTDMIHENNPVTNTYVDGEKINCASYIAGIIAGVLDVSKFVSPRVKQRLIHSSLYVNRLRRSQLSSWKGPSDPSSL